MFWENIRRRVLAISAQLALVKKPGISTSAKSSYYRAASMLACTVVEALVHRTAEHHATTHNGGCIKVLEEWRGIHRLPTTLLNRNDIFVCRKILINLRANDPRVNFKRLNDYLKENGLVTPREFRRLEYVRDRRNQLHMQGLVGPDTGYTKAQFNRISDTLLFMAIKTP